MKVGVSPWLNNEWWAKKTMSGRCNKNFQFIIAFILKRVVEFMISILKSPIHVCFCWDSTSYFIFEMFLVVNHFTIACILPLWALIIYNHLELIIKYLNCLCFLACTPGSHLVSLPKKSSLFRIFKTANSSGAELFFSLFLLFITGLYLSFFISFNSYNNSVIDEEPKV